jgi:hypothetical protein
VEGPQRCEIPRRSGFVHVDIQPGIDIGTAAHAAVAPEQNCLRRQLLGPNQHRKLGLIAKLHYQFVKINHVEAAVFDAAHIRQIRQFAKQVQAKRVPCIRGGITEENGQGQLQHQPLQVSG